MWEFWKTVRTWATAYSAAGGGGEGWPNCEHRGQLRPKRAIQRAYRVLGWRFVRVYTPAFGEARENVAWATAKCRKARTNLRFPPSITSLWVRALRSSCLPTSVGYIRIEAHFQYFTDARASSFWVRGGRILSAVHNASTTIDAPMVPTTAPTTAGSCQPVCSSCRLSASTTGTNDGLSGASSIRLERRPSVAVRFLRQHQ